MFELKGDTNPPVKAFVTVGDLPHHIVPGEIPHAKKPFSTILQQNFTHTVNLLLPEELYSAVWNQIETMSDVSHSRVNMSLSDLIEKEFLNTLIKSGRIQMLSQGRPGIDSLFWLRDGVLHLELPKYLYERAGVQGKPIRDGGQKHVKTRFAIDLNLRLPSMVHGKKGFEQIKWAFKNVLNHTVTWLFLDLDMAKGGENEPTRDLSPLQKHHPIDVETAPSNATLSSMRVPQMSPSRYLSPPVQESILEEETCDLQEWLDLAGMGSPRVRSKDSIDPYLCRYAVPGGKGASTVRNLVRLQWRGFLSPLWIRSLFVECLTATTTEDKSWFALSAHAFPTEAVDGRSGYTILRLAADEVETTVSSEVGMKDPDQADTLRAMRSKYFLWQMSSGYGGNA